MAEKNTSKSAQEEEKGDALHERADPSAQEIRAHRPSDIQPAEKKAQEAEPRPRPEPLNVGEAEPDPGSGVIGHQTAGFGAGGSDSDSYFTFGDTNSEFWPS